jgi:hypothetical protein
MLLRKAIFYIDFIILALYLLQLSYIFFKQKLNLDKIALIALFSYLVAFLFKALETLVDVSNALDDTYILVVDDYNWSKVRNGTQDGIKELGYSVLSSIEIRTTEDDSHPVVSGRYSNWHNGYYIAVISKK